MRQNKRCNWNAQLINLLYVEMNWKVSNWYWNVMEKEIKNSRSDKHFVSFVNFDALGILLLNCISCVVSISARIAYQHNRTETAYLRQYFIHDKLRHIIIHRYWIDFFFLYLFCIILFVMLFYYYSTMQDINRQSHPTTFEMP